ncbi:MAG: PC4/YdbC family ssDNA-binding protein [Alphaproteobacteria bacterium]
MQKHIATILKNAREELRVELTEYRGYDLVAARIWVENSEGAKIPTHKGLTVNVRLLPDILDALRRAEHEARTAGLLDGGE